MKDKILKILRKVYRIIFCISTPPYLDRGCKNPEEASRMIYELLSSNKPCMICRFGSTEMNAICNYLSIQKKEHSIFKYIKGEEMEWWWNPNILDQMCKFSGFFPATKENVNRFSKLMLKEASQIDILGSWLRQEKELIPYMQPNVKKCWLQLLEPYWSLNPWTMALKGKKVLVIHPFAELMEKQYTEKRTLLFSNPKVLPLFSFIPLVAVQSLGGENKNYNDWFEALEDMKHKMDAIDYDITLIGCGAYGFPLASHAKKTGHQAIHLAGALQLLFGIRGKRWDNPMYGSNLFEPGKYQTLFNEYWVYPGKDLKPHAAKNVEGGCYW